MNREQISQGRAVLSAIAIFLYFAIFTAWIPSIVLRSSLLASAPAEVSDLVMLAIWGGFFGAGLYGLRWSQERGLI
jgi:hypothetical protein